MSIGPIRPRFRFTATGSVEEQIERIEAAVARPDSRCVSRVVANHLDITIVREERHRWSPCIQLEFRELDGKTVIDGLVGPHPNLWTLYAFVNITVALAATFGLMLGLAQLMLDQPAWGLWAAPAGVLGLIIMYLVSQIGQRFAAEQTRLLFDLVKAALEDAVMDSTG